MKLLGNSVANIDKCNLPASEWIGWGTPLNIFCKMYAYQRENKQTLINSTDIVDFPAPSNPISAIFTSVGTKKFCTDTTDLLEKIIINFNIQTLITTTIATLASCYCCFVKPTKYHSASYGNTTSHTMLCILHIVSDYST
jgi:hypothetical protein